MLKRSELEVRSGGQNGADFAGIDAARMCGVKTGGVAPKGYRVKNFDGTDGTNPKLADYGLVEHESREYPPRTKQNAIDSEGTVWFGHVESPGGKLTINTCRQNNKPYIINPSPQALVRWMEANKVKVLNVAGNTESKFNPDIYQTTYDCIATALMMLEE